MKEIYEALFNPKGKLGIWGIVALVVLGVLLMVVPGLVLDSKGSEETAQQDPTKSIVRTAPADSLSQLELVMAEQIGSILGSIAGAGKVTVTVALENGLEKEYAVNVTDDRSTIEERDANEVVKTTKDISLKTEAVFPDDRSDALVIKEIGPKVKGVLVVSAGAKDSEIRAKLGRAVQTMLNLPAHRVMVLEGEGGE